jgi:hypothetical protein
MSAADRVDSKNDVIRRELKDCLVAIRNSTYHEHFFGDLEPEKLRMPMKMEDGRKCSWTKKIDAIIVRISNSPSDPKRHCWLYTLGKSDCHYAVFKLGNQTGYGDQAKYRLHRVLYALLHPQMHERVVKDSDFTVGVDNNCSHLCGMGYSKEARKGSVCVNPYHLIWETSKENQDRKVIAFFTSSVLICFVL